MQNDTDDTGFTDMDPQKNAHAVVGLPTTTRRTKTPAGDRQKVAAGHILLSWVPPTPEYLTPMIAKIHEERAWNERWIGSHGSGEKRTLAERYLDDYQTWLNHREEPCEHRENKHVTLYHPDTSTTVELRTCTRCRRTSFDPQNLAFDTETPPTEGN